MIGCGEVHLQRARIWGSSWAFPSGRGTSREIIIAGQVKTTLTAWWAPLAEDRTLLNLRSVPDFPQVLLCPSQCWSSWNLFMPQTRFLGGFICPFSLQYPLHPRPLSRAPNQVCSATIWTSGDIQDASTLPQCSQHLHLLRATESTKVNQDEGKFQARHPSECLNPCIFHSALQQSCNGGPLLALSQTQKHFAFYP